MARRLYLTAVTGASIGLVAAFWQTLQKLTLLENSDVVLVCNLDSVFNCRNVLDAPQSEVFGFPNSIMAVVFMVFFLSISLVGLCGGQIGKTLRFWVQGLAAFMLGFAFWFLFQSTYNIQAICIYCLFIFAGLLLINGAWLRLNYPDYTVAFNKRFKRWIDSGADVFVWLVLVVLVGFAIAFKFYIR